MPAIILAAGESSRLGRPKAMIQIGGQTLLWWAYIGLRNAGCAPIFVVVPPALANIAQHLLPDANIIENPIPERGRTGSLQLGLSGLESIDACLDAGVMMAPIDRPGWNADVILKLQSQTGSSCPINAGQRGHPVFIDPEDIDRIKGADPSSILRDLVSFSGVEVDAPWLTLNVDTEEDVTHLLANESSFLHYLKGSEGI